MRLSRRTRFGAAAATVAFVAAVVWGVAFRRSPPPSEADGRAWLTGFADLLTSPRALGARGPPCWRCSPASAPGTTVIA